MNWNDYEALWKRQELPVGGNADPAALKGAFESKHRKMAAVLSASDLLEAGAGILGCVAYGFIWRQVGRSGWPIAFAIALILAVVGVFMRERIVARRNRLGSDATLLAKVEADIAVLRRRRRLTMGLWKWYLGPTALSVVIVGQTIGASRPPWDIARDPLFRVGFNAFFALLLWFAWEINRRAVRKRLDPRLEELEKLRREINPYAESQAPVARTGGILMKMTKLQVGTLTAIAVLGATGIFMQRRFDARLQAETDRLRQAAAENARLQETNLRLAKATGNAGPGDSVAASAPAAAPSRAAGSAPASRQTVPLASGMTPVETLGNAGRATPRNAFATQLWAARTGDVALEASTITFEPQARARLEALEATLPDDLRTEYDTPERLMAYMLAGSPHPVGGMQVLGEVDVDANDVTLQTEWQHTDDSVVHQSDVNLVQDSDGWKMVVPYSLVNRASNYLSRTLEPPPAAAGPGK